MQSGTPALVPGTSEPELQRTHLLQSKDPAFHKDLSPMLLVVAPGDGLPNKSLWPVSQVLTAIFRPTGGYGPSLWLLVSSWQHAAEPSVPSLAAKQPDATVRTRTPQARSAHDAVL